jgi:hypothetical protein
MTMETWHDTIYVAGLPKDVTEQRCAHARCGPAVLPVGRSPASRVEPLTGAARQSVCKRSLASGAKLQNKRCLGSACKQIAAPRPWEVCGAVGRINIGDVLRVCLWLSRATDQSGLT